MPPVNRATFGKLPRAKHPHTPPDTSYATMRERLRTSQDSSPPGSHAPLTIRLGAPAFIVVEYYDVLGRMVYRRTPDYFLPGEQQRQVLNTDRLAPGVYTLRITASTGDRRSQRNAMIVVVN